MLESKGKISLRQAMVVFLAATSSPSMSVIPNSAAGVAHQAAWLSPIVGFVVAMPIILIYKSIFNKYKEASFMEVIEDILGSVAGKIITALYIVFLTLLLSITLRHFSENFISTIFPNVNIFLFMIVVVFTVAITSRGGIVVLARMSEVILLVLMVSFLAISAFGFKDIEISRLTPVSRLDVFPILGGGLSIIPVLAIFSYTFLLSNYINNKEKIIKVCTQALLLFTFLITVLLLLTVGILGDSTVESTSTPFILMVKQIRIFDSIERIEALVVNMWVISDFVVMSIIIFAVNNMFKSLFKLSDPKPLIRIYLVIAFITGLIVARNIFEMQTFEMLLLPAHIFFAYILPVFVLVVGKIRKKI